jgi:beta-lactamase regulating signal transducer with metallopeptidase domain
MIDQLTNHLWQSTLFAVAAGLLTVAFRKNRAQVRYWLWFSASFKFFVPFALLLSLGSHLRWAPAAKTIATDTISITIVQMAQPFPDISSFVPPPQGTVHWVPLAISGVWVCGFGVVALTLFRGWLRVKAALRVSSPLEIPAPVEIRSSPGLLEPGVVGLFHPVLLLPKGIVERLTPSQLGAVLAHELCHVRRRDNLFASIHMLVEAVFWFHPLVWWIGTRLVEERERACDEAVLSLGSEPRIYADAIVSVCRLYVESPLACVSGVTGANLKRRIEAIMTSHTGEGLNRAKQFLLAGAGIAALAVPVAVGVVIGILHAPAVRAQSPLAISSIVQTAQTVPSAPVNSAAQTSTSSAAPSTPQDRRQLVLLFDFSAMTSDEQSRVRQSAINFIHRGSSPDDVVAIMTVDGVKVAIAQDFTNDQAVLDSAILKLSAGDGDTSVVRADRVASSMEMAANLLAAVPGKKALMYFASGLPQAGANLGERISRAVLAAQAANVALFPIDAQAAPPGGRSMYVQATPLSTSPSALLQGYGIGPQYDEVRAKLGSESSARARTYLLHGPPDQIEDHSSNSQNPSEIWRYNYLENFHSSVEFEFATGKNAGSRDMRINWPPPTATYYGVPGAPAALAEALSRQGQGGRGAAAATASTNIIAGLPAGDASMQVWPGGELQTLLVPLASIAGEVDIEGQIRTAAPNETGRTVAAVADRFQPGGAYQAKFILGAGSYVCDLIVRNRATGQIYGETIDFDVK